MLDRRQFVVSSAATAAASIVNATSLAMAGPVTAAVKVWNGKPTLFVRDQPVYACFYALTDCPGGRWSWDEGPRQSIRAFVDAGFRLFQLDLFLEELEFAQTQIRGILDVCPDAAVVLRWHVNAPASWREAHPGELTRYANGEFETIDRTVPVRILQDDLRRTPRASFASEVWMDLARQKSVDLLRSLVNTAEGNALAGIHVACGVYGEWHYWGFMRNEPDVSEPMQKRFAEWRKAHGKPVVPIPGVEERRALDDGIFRDPARRAEVIDYYRCQQELTADRMLDLCALVKKNWPRPIVTGTFYGYFFSMFDRQATGGHLCLHRVLESPHVDYLSAPQAYGNNYRGMGASGITRGLVETVRHHGKLFLDEMDETPSWKWLNNVDTAFQLSDAAADVAILRRNVMESYARGAGLWYYDFGPANRAGWWMDRRLMAEIGNLKAILERYHRREYRPGGDVLMVFDTEVFYYTGSIQGTDRLTDPLAVNQTISEAWKSGAALETIHLRDLESIDLTRFRIVVFANTWLMTAAQRRFIREKVNAAGRHIVFQGTPGYCDGQRLSVELAREVTGLDLRKKEGLPFQPAFVVGDGTPGLSRHGRVWFATTPPEKAAEWRTIFEAAGVHLYTDAGDVVHAGGGLVLIHTKEGGPRVVSFRGGQKAERTLPAKSSTLYDAATGQQLL